MKSPQSVEMEVRSQPFPTIHLTSPTELTGLSTTERACTSFCIMDWFQVQPRASPEGQEKAIDRG